MRHARRFLAVCAACALAAPTVRAQPPGVLSADTLAARAERALADGRIDEARETARALVSRAGRRADSHVLRARTLLAGPAPEPRAAYRAVTEALVRDRVNADALALRLALERQGQGVGRLPTVLRAQQRRDTATRILRTDSATAAPLGRALALLELGEQAYDVFDFNALRIDPALLVRRGRPDDSAFDLGVFENDGVIVRFTGESDRAAAEARDALRRAYRIATTTPDGGRTVDVVPRDTLASGAARLLARLYGRTGETTSLLGLALTERRRRPSDAAPWRWQGLALYTSGQVGGAAAAFDSARVRLSPDLRATLDDPARIARPADRDRVSATADAAEAFWAAADPRRLTDVNERRAEHDARLALADLTLSENVGATPGRDTERGRVLVRYGQPVRRATYSLGADPAYNVVDVWEYERQRFVFAAVTRRAPFELYTPPAGAFRRQPEQARTDDYVQQYQDITRRSPAETTYAPLARVPIAMQVAAFRADDARVDLVVVTGAPLTVSERDAWAPSRVGVALLRDGERVEAERKLDIAARPDSSLLDLAGGALWLHAETLRVRPGRYRLRAEVEIGTGGPVGVEALDLSAPLYERRFALSDVLLAHRIRPATAADSTDLPTGFLRRRGRVLLPAAEAAFERSMPFYTYFEVYGLTTRAGGAMSYEVETTLSPVARGGEGISTAFTVTGRGATDDYAGRLDASSLAPGRYRLRLRIRDLATQQTVETTRDVTLR